MNVAPFTATGHAVSAFLPSLHFPKVKQIFSICCAETDELLSNRTPLKPANNCDTKRNSFKSLGLLNGSAPTMSEIITTGKHKYINTAFIIQTKPRQIATKV